MSEPELIKKLKYLLLQISKQNSESALIEILSHSEFTFKKHWNQGSFPNLFNMTIKLTPDVYTKYYNNMGRYEQILNDRINNSSELMIDKLNILPDYDKLEIISSEIFPVRTEWEGINQYQQKLLEDFKRSSNSMDYQNLGNTARTIMDKLAREIFDPQKHKPNNPSKDVQNGKFKNQLHAYIDSVLSGSKNREFRLLAESSIEFVERSVDIMNNTTHKIDAERHLAEVCMISTISAVSIIKLVKELE